MTTDLKPTSRLSLLQFAGPPSADGNRRNIQLTDRVTSSYIGLNRDDAAELVEALTEWLDGVRKTEAEAEAEEPTAILIVRARSLDDQAARARPTGPLAILRRTEEGWHSVSLTTAHKNGRRWDWPTWEAALPRWTGGLDRTESRRMEPGENVTAVLDRWNDR